MNTRISIMIIDDSFTNRVLLKAIFEDLDISIIEVHSGIKALKILEEFEPDIILLDMCMPQMNGLDFLKELKVMKKNIPVIIVSVLDDQNYINQSLQYGASEYLLKPININKLLAAISKYTECEINL